MSTLTKEEIISIDKEIAKCRIPEIEYKLEQLNFMTIKGIPCSAFPNYSKEVRFAKRAYKAELKRHKRNLLK